MGRREGTYASHTEYLAIGALQTYFLKVRLKGKRYPYDEPPALIVSVMPVDAGDVLIKYIELNMSDMGHEFKNSIPSHSKADLFKKVKGGSVYQGYVEVWRVDFYVLPF